MGEQKLVPERRKNSNWRKYAGYGVTAFLVIAAAVVIVFIFVRMEEFSDMIGSIFTAITPVIYGIVFAYLMNPLMNVFEKLLRPVFFKHSKKASRAKKTVRVLSLVITLSCVGLGIGIIVYMLVPELSKTTETLIENIPKQYDKFVAWFDELMVSDTKFGEIVAGITKQVYTYVDNFIENGLVDGASGALGILASVGKGFMNVMEVIYNVAIGLTFAIYFLYSKEKYIAQVKKLLYAFAKRKKANNIIRIAKACHLKFSGTINGKIVDSAVIGLLCFIVMLIFNLPYKLLISVIVGVTNVIPYFGPFIGAIPSAFLILMEDPTLCLIFIISIVVIQQVDSNILTPKIVGDSIGLSPFWVLFACVFFGSLFGLLGLLIGVPVMACIYMLGKEWVESRLKRKGLRTETDEYATIDFVDEQEMVLVECGDVPEKISIDEYNHKQENSANEKEQDVSESKK